MVQKLMQLSLRYGGAALVSGIIKMKKRKGKKVVQVIPKRKIEQKGIKGMNGITMKTK